MKIFLINKLEFLEMITINHIYYLFPFNLFIFQMNVLFDYYFLYQILQKIFPFHSHYILNMGKTTQLLENVETYVQFRDVNINFILEICMYPSSSFLVIFS